MPSRRGFIFTNCWFRAGQMSGMYSCAIARVSLILKLSIQTIRAFNLCSKRLVLAGDCFHRRYCSFIKFTAFTIIFASIANVPYTHRTKFRRRTHKRKLRLNVVLRSPMITHLRSPSFLATRSCCTVLSFIAGKKAHSGRD